MKQKRQRQRSSRERVRVRANLHTISLTAVVLAMVYAGAVQQNGAAYLLAFVAAALGGISYIHARANLRGLNLRGVTLPPGQEGRMAKLTVNLDATTGAAVHGLELLVIGAPKATFIDTIASGHSQRVSLIVPAQEEGTQQTVRLLARSAYPMGLFSAERVIELVCPRRIHPRPEGNLPLPAPHRRRQANALAQTGRSNNRTSRDGDDFAGLREWQRGDSLNHIDWRSAERGRPLMVKTWAANVSEAVHLDWQELSSLTDQDRSRQLAKWIEICEGRGLPYSLSLPQEEITVGLGPAHAKRCLDALADLHVRMSGQSELKDSKTTRIPPSFERSAHLPRGPLFMLSLFLLMAALPLWEIVGPEALAVLLVCLVWRILSQQHQKWKPILVTAMGVGLICLSQETLLSMEAGIAVLIVLLGGKLLESRTPHDFQVLSMVGWFLCLCGLLAEQTLSRSLYTFLIFAGMTFCMVRFRRSVPGIGTPLQRTLGFMAQAIPIALIIFVIFPRGSFDYLARFGTNRITRAGIPTELNPAEIARIAQNSDIAFHVKFPDGNVPSSENRYWRCVVLWDCQGMRWNHGPILEYSPQGKPVKQPQDVRHIIDLEPHNQYWLPALDRPLMARDSSGPVLLESDDTLRSGDPVRLMRRIEVSSRPFKERLQLLPSQRAAALQLPSNLPASMRKLASEWRAKARTDLDIVTTGLSYLQTNGYNYTLNPGEYPEPNALEEFWFNRRIGFCGHFSAAFATMMRLAGVPTRVVMGYQGGEWSDLGGYMIVRQSDAHAWLEVYLEATGWTRVDPTAVLAPGRLNASMQSFIFGTDPSAQQNSLLWRTILRVRTFWDHISYQWYNYVVGYDEESQWQWLDLLGLGRLNRNALLRSAVLFGLSILVVAIGWLILTLWLKRPAQHRDPWVRAWKTFCYQLTRLGLPPRLESEGPLAYANRVSKAEPSLAAPITHLATTYAAARYGGQPASISQFKRSIRELKKHRRRSKS